MKTAEEHINYTVCFYYQLSENQKFLVLKAMKDYAKEVAEQALNNADKDVEEQLKVFGPKDEYISEAILKAKIQLP